MDDFYELIDLVSGNLAGDYDSANDALAALVVTAERYGRPAIESFSLMRIQGDEQSLVAMQEDLVELVEAYAHQAKEESVSRAS
jgi:hypothetical protein